ncbi:hypothetical protein GQ53DRAFT_327498 [Thozetella sp. PMI_491]|nr:hypothetical protein GQ53DRAFT_327498 [Thozetella sp. PMI_491]
MLPPSMPLNSLPAFNIFNALGIEKPTSSLTAHDLLERLALILELYRVPNLRPTELIRKIFPTLWQVGEAFSSLVSFDIRNDGPGARLKINKDNLNLALELYHSETYRRSFFPELGSEGPGEQRRTVVWPFINWQTPQLGLPQAENKLYPTRRYGMLPPIDMRIDLGDMLVPKVPDDRSHQAHESGGVVKRGTDIIEASAAEGPERHSKIKRKRSIVFRRQASFDSSDSDEKGIFEDHGPDLPSPGYAIMVGFPIAQAHLHREDRQLAWAMFSRKRHLVLTLRRENVRGQTLPLEKLLRMDDGRFVTAVKLQDLVLCSPWRGLEVKELEKEIGSAAWAAYWCAASYDSIGHRRPEGSVEEGRSLRGG